jgi:hypothetical protein
VPAAVVAPAADPALVEAALVEALVLAVWVGVDAEDDVVAGALPVFVVVDELDPDELDPPQP